MDYIKIISLLIISYLLGSLPFGLIAVKLRTGKDIRKVGSGRTGTTNALRAAGSSIAIITLVLDVLKGASAVWLARWLIPDNAWWQMLAPVATIVGHNYSIFLAERNEKGQYKMRGGAGGAPALGGAIGLHPASIFFLVPISLAIYFGVGYASVTTMSVPFIGAIIFGIQAWKGLSPWSFVIYFLIVGSLLTWALRPNIRRLVDGTERSIGWRLRKSKGKEEN